MSPKENETKMLTNWKPGKTAIISMAAAAAIAGSAGLLATTNSTQHVTNGSVEANTSEIRMYADEVKTREAAAAAQEAAAAAQIEAALIAALESQVHDDMQRHFEDPVTALPITITVGKVNLVRVSATTFDGWALMQAKGYPAAHQIFIHVVADDDTVMWEVPAGGLLPLIS